MVGATEDAFRPPMGTPLPETAFEEVAPDYSRQVGFG